MNEHDAKKTCRNCFYWKDWSDRVYAIVSGKETSFANNRVELRRCRYVAPPQVNVLNPDIFTDENYSCSEFRGPQ